MSDDSQPPPKPRLTQAVVFSGLIVFAMGQTILFAVIVPRHGL